MRPRHVGNLPDGRAVQAYRLLGEGGFSVEILNFGGIIREIMVPDREGHLENVVLHYDDLSDYAENPAYIGALVGRTGGRIGPKGLVIDGSRFTLEKNHRGLTLHGGPVGFHKKTMEVVKVDTSELAMRFTSPAGEGGFPGRLEVALIFRVEGQSLEMTIEMRTTALTYANPTHHTYFNLSGDPASTVKSGTLRLGADAVALVDDQMLPTGWQAVEALGLGAEALQIGHIFSEKWDQLAATGGIDHPFRLSTRADEPAAVYREPATGRTLEVCSDAPCLVVYTGNFLSEARVPSGRRFADHTGICFEAQELPDAPNNGLSVHRILRPGEVQQRKIVYRFK